MQKTQKHPELDTKEDKDLTHRYIDYSKSDLSMCGIRMTRVTSYRTQEEADAALTCIECITLLGLL